MGGCPWREGLGVEGFFFWRYVTADSDVGIEQEDDEECSMPLTRIRKI